MPPTSTPEELAAARLAQLADVPHGDIARYVVELEKAARELNSRAEDLAEENDKLREAVKASAIEDLAQRVGELDAVTECYREHLDRQQFTGNPPPADLHEALLDTIDRIVSECHGHELIERLRT
ncbi:hypothetical protein SEA_OBLADI_129 [Gordonia phage ObLaDi]|uniref:Uncharacterized protein n=2 Tax=Cafassovirus TaxID=3425056 RepID=A0A9E7QBP9_9CAUD|nr:hypothetical protein SEA_ALEEMILY_128 [Gordonia phage Aleemily]UXE03852.1 hypothetical protein SEA_OBLADI_129 [Gordonia phage ObLaDi]